MTRAVLLDYGNTLVDFYQRDEFPSILRAALQEAGRRMGADFGPAEAARAREEDHERQDLWVRPLEGRLSRIFGMVDCQTLAAGCRGFVSVIRDHSRERSQSREILRLLRARGYLLGLISNTPWGSPSDLWREDLAQRRMLDLFHLTLFCRDVGLRKPSPAIFARALNLLGLAAREAVFVGDDPRWDVVGALKVGMEAILLDSSQSGTHSPSIADLSELMNLLPGPRGERSL